MNKKELKHLKRSQLLELLIEQTKENNELRLKLEAANAKLAEKEIQLSNAGTIARASLELNGVFEAAQNAADQYIENIKRMEKEQQELCESLRQAEKALEEEKERLSSMPCSEPEPETVPEEKKPRKRSLFKREK